MVIGVLALVAAVGLYGVVSDVMSGRGHEFGVRLALGATPSSTARLVLERHLIE
jgi:ABC-type antimicrobial peptide transport system permease subunit